jgi:hypothetical protein
MQRTAAWAVAAALSLAIVAQSQRAAPAAPKAAAAAGLAPAPPTTPKIYANLDPDDDLVVAPPPPRASCADDLKAAGVRFRAASLPVHQTGKKRTITCGAEQVVLYQRGPGKIAYSPSPVLTCSMALALARFEAILQEETLRAFKKPVVRIRQLGTYACREMANYPGWVSEHSYANAIDLEAFVLQDGTEISVLKNFEKTEGEPKKKAGKLLLTVARRAYDEGVFSAVLTPYFDAAHRNHFHLDLSRYRADGTRP